MKDIHCERFWCQVETKYGILQCLAAAAPPPKALDNLGQQTEK